MEYAQAYLGKVPSGHAPREQGGGRPLSSGLLEVRAVGLRTRRFRVGRIRGIIDGISSCIPLLVKGMRISKYRMCLHGPRRSILCGWSCNTRMAPWDHGLMEIRAPGHVLFWLGACHIAYSPRPRDSVKCPSRAGSDPQTLRIPVVTLTRSVRRRHWYAVIPSGPQRSC